MPSKRRPASPKVIQRKRKGNTGGEVVRCHEWPTTSPVFIFRVLAQYSGGPRWDIGAEYVICRRDSSPGLVHAELVAEVRAPLLSRNGRDVAGDGAVKADDATAHSGFAASGGLESQRHPSETIPVRSRTDRGISGGVLDRK